MCPQSAVMKSKSIMFLPKRIKNGRELSKSHSFIAASQSSYVLLGQDLRWMESLPISRALENNVVLFIEHKLLYNVRGTVPEDSYTIPLGSASVKRTGNDVTVIATSIMVPRALEAAEVLAKEGTDVEVIDPRTLKPLDTGVMIESIKKTGRALVIHEAPKTGGVGGEIVASLLEGGAFDYLDAPLRRLCGQDIPIPYNLRMERATVPQADDISGAVKALMA